MRGASQRLCDAKRTPIALTRSADQAYHDRIAAAFDEAYDAPGGRAYTEAFTRRILTEAPVRAGQRVLDVGCGTGRFAVAIALQSDTGLGAGTGALSVVGVDQSRAMLARAARHAASAGVGQPVSFLQGTASAIPVCDGAFDLVLCFGVLHHTVGEGDPTGQDVLREMARVTRPGGRVVVVEPNAWNPYFFTTTWVWHGLQDRVAGYPRIAHERPLTMRFLRGGLARAGLVVERVATASPVEAFRGRNAGAVWKAAQWALEGPLRAFGTHVMAVGKRPG